MSLALSAAQQLLCGRGFDTQVRKIYLNLYVENYTQRAAAKERPLIGRLFSCYNVTRGGSFSQKIETANPRYFIMLCGISCELAGCVHRPVVDSESMIAE